MLVETPVFEAVWQRFREGPSTLGPDPGVREAWHRGRPHFAVWVLRVEAADVLTRLETVTTALAAHGARAGWSDPHVTVFVAGFPSPAPTLDDDVSERALLAQAEALRGRSSPRLRIGGLNAFLSCPFLEVHDPHGDIAALREALEPHTREIRFERYTPHLTVCPFAETRSTAPIAAAIRPLRELPPLELRPAAVELVHLDSFTPGAALTTVARVPFESFQ